MNKVMIKNLYRFMATTKDDCLFSVYYYKFVHQMKKYKKVVI